MPPAESEEQREKREYHLCQIHWALGQMSIDDIRQPVRKMEDKLRETE